MSESLAARILTCSRERYEKIEPTANPARADFNRGIFQVASVGLPMAVKAPGLPCQTLAIALSLLNLVSISTPSMRFSERTSDTRLLNNHPPRQFMLLNGASLPIRTPVRKRNGKRGSTDQRVWLSSRRAKIDRYTSTATKSTIITDEKDKPLLDFPSTSRRSISPDYY